MNTPRLQALNYLFPVRLTLINIEECQWVEWYSNQIYYAQYILVCDCSDLWLLAISKDHDMSRDSAQVRGNCDWAGH